MEAKRVPLRQSGCVGLTLAGRPAYARRPRETSLLCLVVLGRFASFPGRLDEAASVGHFVLDCGFACPVLTLDNDKSTCGAALGLAENTGEKTKQNHLGLFCPSGK